MNLKPLGNRVILKVIKEEEKIVGGIVLPETAKSNQDEGTVVAVGTGKYHGETLVPIPLKVGDVVIYKDYSGSNIDLDENGDYVIINADDVLAIKE